VCMRANTQLGGIEVGCVYVYVYLCVCACVCVCVYVCVCVCVHMCTTRTHTHTYTHTYIHKYRLAKALDPARQVAKEEVLFRQNDSQMKVFLLLLYHFD